MIIFGSFVYFSATRDPFSESEKRTLKKVCGLDESKKNIQWLVSNSWGLCLFGCEFMSQQETWYKYSPNTYLTHFPVVKVMGDYLKKNESRSFP